MSKRELKYLWLGIVAVVAALAFPPYGYDHGESSITLFRTGETTTKIVRVPWKYIGHVFILSPPRRDKELDQYLEKNREDRSVESLSDWISMFNPFIQIGWHILIIEIVVISLVTAGVLFTVRMARK